jgi:hypothetical protein
MGKCLDRAYDFLILTNQTWNPSNVKNTDTLYKLDFIALKKWNVKNLFKSWFIILKLYLIVKIVRKTITINFLNTFCEYFC